MARISSFIFNFRKSEIFRLFGKSLLFLPIFGIVAITNYTVDPAARYKGESVEMKIASALAAGKNLANTTNYDERLVQKFLIKSIKTRPDAVILGSSRAMQIGDNVFKGRVVNNCVSGASLEDYLGIFYLYTKSGFLPRQVVIGLDPWVLNRYSKEDRWVSIGQEASELAAEFNERLQYPKPPAIPLQVSTLFSPSYFKAALRKVATRIGNGWEEENRPTLEVSGLSQFRLKDGRVYYASSYLAKTPSMARGDAVKYAESASVPSLSNYRDLDPQYCRILNSLIGRLRELGINVTFFLPPFHPEAFARLSYRPDTKIILKAEKFYRDLAKEHGIKVIGSYSPERLEIREDEYLDGMHIKDSAVVRILKAGRIHGPI